MRARSNKPGFSLGEILVAIAIVAVIAAVVIPSVGSQLRSGDESRILQDITSIRSASEQFLADVRRYPVSVGQLVGRPAVTDTGLVGGVFTTSQVNRWRGPYLAKDSVSAVATGFDETINSLFKNLEISVAGQKYLTMLIPNFDSVAARNIDLRSDDGVKTTGSIQWADSAITTLKFFAIPIQ